MRLRGDLAEKMERAKEKLLEYFLARSAVLRDLLRYRMREKTRTKRVWG